MKILVTVSAVALLACSMAMAVDAKKPSAQDTTKSVAARESAPDKKAQDSSAELPKPSAEMKKLARMIAGRWQVEEKYEVSAITPQGGEGKGTAVIHRGPGGLSLITNYNSTGSMGEVQGAGITTWSPEEKVHKQFWVDNGSAAGSLWTGKWDGDSLVYTATQKMGEQMTYWRETYAAAGSDSFTMTFEMGSTGKDLKKIMTLKFTRMSKQALGERRHGMGMHGRPSSDGWSGPRADMTLR